MNGGGSSMGGSTGVKKGTPTPTPTKTESPLTAEINEPIKIKCFYYYKPISATDVKKILEAVKGVTEVKIDDVEFVVTGKYSGPLKDVTKTELACGNTGISVTLISHARVIVALTPQQGVDSAKFKAALATLKGVKAAEVGSETAEVFVDLEVFNVDDFYKTALDCGFKAVCRTHEWVDLALKGEQYDSSGKGSSAGAIASSYAGLNKELAVTRGVILRRIDADANKAALVTLKKIADETFKKMAEKVGTVLGAIGRK